MVEKSGPKASLLVGGRDASSPSHAAKRAAQRQKGPAFCAHAPEPYAAMASRGDWSTELWDIFAQPGGPNLCCLSLWCPCIQYGLLLEQLPPGSVLCAGSAAGGCSLFCALWLLGDLLGAALLTKVVTLPCTALVHAQTRGHLRRKYGIQSHPIHDFFIVWCCPCCALIQEARETVIRQAAEREDSSGSSRVVVSRSNSLHGVLTAGGSHPAGPLEQPQLDLPAAAVPGAAAGGVTGGPGLAVVAAATIGTGAGAGMSGSGGSGKAEGKTTEGKVAAAGAVAPSRGQQTVLSAGGSSPALDRAVQAAGPPPVPSSANESSGGGVPHPHAHPGRVAPSSTPFHHSHSAGGSLGVGGSGGSGGGLGPGSAAPNSPVRPRLGSAAPGENRR